MTHPDASERKVAGSGVQAVNIEARLYMDKAGVVWPITNFFDVDGEPCESWEQPFSAVAGKDNDWFAINLTEFDGKPS